MRGLKTDVDERQTVIRGHAFSQNLVRRGHYELGCNARHQHLSLGVSTFDESGTDVI